MENSVPKITLQYCRRLTRPWVFLSIIGVLLLFMNQSTFAQQRVPVPCTNPIPVNLVGVDATGPTNKNAKIRLTGVPDGEYRVGYSIGDTYTGPGFDGATTYSVIQSDSSFMARNQDNPTTAAGTKYIVRVFNKDTTCYYDHTFILERVNFNTAPKRPDISVNITRSGGEYAAFNSSVTVTVKVKNTGNAQATGVEFKIGIPDGFTNVTATAPAGTTYNSTTGTWEIGTVAFHPTDEIVLTLVGTVSKQGVQYVTADLTKENEIDEDSSPTSKDAGEDDYSSVCISTPFDYCNNDVYTISLPNYTGVKWFKDGEEITLTNAAGLGVIYADGQPLVILKTGIYSYTTTVNNCPPSGCCPIKIEAITPPKLDDTDLAQNICYKATFPDIKAKLEQLPKSGIVVYEWYNDNGANNPGTEIIAGQTTDEFTAKPTEIGVYKYKLKIYDKDHKNCADSITFTLTIRELPIVAITEVKAVCDKNTISFKLEGTFDGATFDWVGPVASGFKSLVANPVILNANINNDAGVYTVTVSMGSNGLVCSATATTEVKINPLPPAPDVNEMKYCPGDTPLPLVAPKLANYSLLWYTEATATAKDAHPDPYTPGTAVTKSTGTTEFFVTQKDDVTGCESPKAMLLVRVHRAPEIPKVANATYCQGAPAIPLSFTLEEGNTPLWFKKEANGDIVAEPTAPTPATDKVGITIYYASQKETETGCISERDTITVQINTTPLPPIIADNKTTYCEGETPQDLKAEAEGSNNILWIIGGTTSTTPPPVHTEIAGLTNYYVFQSIPGGCESGWATIPVTVNPKPVAEVLPLSALCVGSTSQSNAQLILTRYRDSDKVSYSPSTAYDPATATAFTTIADGAGGVFASTLPNPTATQGTQAYTVRIQNTYGCTVDRNEVINYKDCGCPGGYCEPATIEQKRAK